MPIRTYPVWTIEPRIARVGHVQLPSELVDAYPQIVMAAKLREGTAGEPDSVLLIRAHVRHGDEFRERGLVVSPGKNLEILTRLDEFTLAIPRAELAAIQASVH